MRKPSEPSKVRRVNELIQRSIHHREQLQAMAWELVTLHDVNLMSQDAQDLMRVIHCGDSYQQAMRSILNRKLQEMNGNNSHSG